MGHAYLLLLGAWSSVNRIEAFLLKEDKHLASTDSSSLTSSVAEEKSEKEEFVVHCQNASIGIRSLDKTFLRNVSMKLGRNSLTVIAGSVASGKSSLLLGLLQEYDILAGSVTRSVSNDKIAFASQDNYLQPTRTIRDNILFGCLYDRKRFSDVIKACALVEDLATRHNGDLSLASDLSGGQRSRISLARCLYSNAELVILDVSLILLTLLPERN